MLFCEKGSTERAAKAAMRVSPDRTASYVSPHIEDWGGSAPARPVVHVSPPSPPASVERGLLKATQSALGGVATR